MRFPTFVRMALHEKYMRRCIALAKMGAGNTAPNPMVGAVLVYQDQIIGEGFHEQYGKAHAEVNCIQNVLPQHIQNIPHAVLYVSLEPCNHFGKTPPCTELIIRNQIKKVVIGCRDPFEAVNGKGIESLKAAGIEVELGILEKECKELNHAFFTFHTKHRPYIILKWAQSRDGFIAHSDYSSVRISNPYTNILVHKWRSEIQSIMIGTNTAKYDNPLLTNRWWNKKQPIRIILDQQLKLPSSHQVFNNDAPTLVLNGRTQSFEASNNLQQGQLVYQLMENSDHLSSIINALYPFHIIEVLVEGGARLLQSFLDENTWDEARVITNNTMILKEGIHAPRLPKASIKNECILDSDQIITYLPQ